MGLDTTPTPGHSQERADRAASAGTSERPGAPTGSRIEYTGHPNGYHQHGLIKYYNLRKRRSGKRATTPPPLPSLPPPYLNPHYRPPYNPHPLSSNIAKQ